MNSISKVSWIRNLDLSLFSVYGHGDRSKTLIQIMERPSHMEYKWFAISYAIKHVTWVYSFCYVFQILGQGYKVNNIGIARKVFPQSPHI
jgi:hypothetical protein